MVHIYWHSWSVPMVMFLSQNPKRCGQKAQNDLLGKNASGRVLEHIQSTTNDEMLCKNASGFWTRIQWNASSRSGQRIKPSRSPILLSSLAACHRQFVRVGDTTENLWWLSHKFTWDTTYLPTCIDNMLWTRDLSCEVVKLCGVKIMRWWRWADNEGPAAAPRWGWIHLRPKPPKLRRRRGWGAEFWEEWSNPGAPEKAARLWGGWGRCERLCQWGARLCQWWLWPWHRRWWWGGAGVLENGMSKIILLNIKPNALKIPHTNLHSDVFLSSFAYFWEGS